MLIVIKIVDNSLDHFLQSGQSLHCFYRLIWDQTLCHKGSNRWSWTCTWSIWRGRSCCRRAYVWKMSSWKVNTYYNIKKDIEVFRQLPASRKFTHYSIEWLITNGLDLITKVQTSWVKQKDLFTIYPETYISNINKIVPWIFHPKLTSMSIFGVGN